AELRALTAVYSCYFPEVRAVVDEVVARYPHEVFLRSLGAGLDDFHVPIIEKLCRFQREAAPDLSGFPHRYPTAGSEEGIREFMTRLATEGVREIHVLHGEYEGYREVARSRGIAAVEVPMERDPRALPPGTWFVSNPSARDGNVLPDEWLGRLL